MEAEAEAVVNRGQFRNKGDSVKYTEFRANNVQNARTTMSLENRHLVGLRGQSVRGGVKHDVIVLTMIKRCSLAKPFGYK